MTSGIRLIDPNNPSNATHSSNVDNVSKLSHKSTKSTKSTKSQQSTVSKSGKPNQTNNDCRPSGILDGSRASGVFQYVRPLNGSLEHVPDLLCRHIQSDVQLCHTREALVLFVTNHPNSKVNSLTTRETVELAFASDWKELVSVHAMSQLDLLCLRVELLEIVIQTVPANHFIVHKDLRQPSIQYTVLQQVTMWLTAHVPMWIYLTSQLGPDKPDRPDQQVPRSRLPAMRLSIGVHLLPDVSGVVHRLDFNNSFNSKHSSTSAFMHIVSKALPRRCQIRELGRFLIGYFSEHADLGALFDRMIGLSLLGLYPNQGDCPRWGFRHLVEMYGQLMVPTQPDRVAGHFSYRLLRMQTKHNASQMQAVFFYFIRDFLAYQIRILPVLRQLLCLHHAWAEFEDTLQHHMRHCRERFQGAVWLNDRFDYSSLEVFMHTLYSTNSKSRLKMCTGRKLTCHETFERLHGLMQKQVAGMGPAWYKLFVQTFAEYRQSDESGQANLLGRVLLSSSHPLYDDKARKSHRIVVTLFRDLHTGNEPGVKAGLDKLEAADPKRFCRLYHEVGMGLCALRTEVHPLPMHVWLFQTLATAQVWRAAGFEDLPTHANAFAYCKACGQVKCAHSLSVRAKGTKKRPLKPAHGSMEVIVDDNLNCLCCMQKSGHTAKVPTGVPSNSADDLGSVEGHVAEEDPAAKAEPVHLRLANLYCSTLPLVHLHLLGNVVFHSGQCFGVCQECGCITEFDEGHMHTFLCHECGQARRDGQLKGLELFDPETNSCQICGVHFLNGNSQTLPVLQPGHDQLCNRLKVCLGCHRLAGRQVQQPKLLCLHELQQAVRVNRCKRALSTIGLKRKNRW